MRTLYIVLFVLSWQLSNGQNLISRTLEGDLKVSTPEPKQLAGNVSSKKQMASIDLFTWEQSDKINQKHFITLKLNTKALAILKSEELSEFEIDIPVAQEQSFTLLFTRSEVFTDESRILFPDGTQQEIPVNEILTLRGVIRGDHGSIATLTKYQEEIFISIVDSEGDYRIAPDQKIQQDSYKLYEDHSKEENPFICDVPDGDELKIADVQPGLPRRKAAGDIVEVYVECDYRLFQNKGGTSGVMAYVTALFNEVATLYLNEGIIVEVSDVFIWNRSDPYAGISNTYNALLAFGSTKQNNYNGRLAALLKGNTSGFCSVSGIAWVDVLCSNYFPSFQGGPYSVTAGVGRCPHNAYPSFSVDVAVVTHELGHNMGSPHTHSCCWGPSFNRA